MATINDDRAKLLAGQAEQLRDDTRAADDLLSQGRIDEARALVARSVGYARAVWHELYLLTQPPSEAPMRGKSRGR